MMRSRFIQGIPSGKLTVCYGKSLFLMGKSTISMAIVNSYVSLPEGKYPLSVPTLGLLYHVWTDQYY